MVAFAGEFSGGVDAELAADGDLVWIHLHSKQNAEDALGIAVVNIFRMQDGKFVEHWNVVQAVPEESANNNTMF